MLKSEIFVDKFLQEIRRKLITTQIEIVDLRSSDTLAQTKEIGGYVDMVTMLAIYCRKIDVDLGNVL